MRVIADNCKMNRGNIVTSPAPIASPIHLAPSVVPPPLTPKLSRAQIASLLNYSINVIFVEFQHFVTNVLQQSETTPETLRNLKSIKELLIGGIERFNISPKDGLKYLQGTSINLLLFSTKFLKISKEFDISLLMSLIE
jgi:hypothetical protein